MHKIFDPFFAAREAGKGVDPGLSVCYGIVKDHGGRIRAKSEEVKGAALMVELPVTKATEALEERVEVATVAARSGMNVLVVDDRPDIMGMIPEALEKQGDKVERRFRRWSCSGTAGGSEPI